MRNPKDGPGQGIEDVELFFDPEFDPDTFVEAMSEDTVPVQERAAWQRLEEWREARALRAELADWEDWDEVD